RELLLSSVGVSLAPEKFLAVGVVFFPTGAPESAEKAREEFEPALAGQHLTLLAWRDVPIRREVLGEIALSTLPIIRHALITADDLGSNPGVAESKQLDRRLYLARKQFERAQAPLGDKKAYVCSL